MGLPVPAPAELVAFVGPPILDGFRDLGLDPVQSATALELYRERYRAVGAFHSRVYTGVPEALDRLREHLPLAIATSKPEVTARAIIEHFGLESRFAVVAGASEDETRSAKAEVVAWAIEQLAAAGVDVSRPVMVGDRSHDVQGAAAHGIPTVFAEWGYGSPTEAIGTLAIAHEPVDLPRLILDPLLPG